VNFRAAAQKIAGELSSDMAMDPTSMATQDSGDLRANQPDPTSDDSDPATPGGAAMYNGALPFGEPVASDPEWRDPQDGPRSGGPVPYTPGPGVDTTTIHNARRASYEQKITRMR
jgi:hypothetical protein